MAVVIKLKDGSGTIRAKGYAAEKLIIKDENSREIMGEFPMEIIKYWYNEPSNLTKGDK